MAYLLFGQAAGKLVARIGLRSATLGGLLLIVLTCLSNYFASNIVWLVAGNLLQGVGMLVLVVAAQIGAGHAGGTEGQGRRVALWASAPTVGLALGLMLSSSAVDSQSWRMAFLFLGAIAALVFVLVLLVLPAEHGSAQRVSAPPDTRRLFSEETGAVRASLALLLAILMLNGSVNVWPIFLSTLHKVSIGAIAARSSLGMLAGIGGSLAVAAALAAGVPRSRLALTIAALAILSATAIFSGLGGLPVATVAMVVSGGAGAAAMALAVATLPIVVRRPDNLPAATGLLYQISSIGAIFGAPLSLAFLALPCPGLSLAILVTISSLAMTLILPVWRPAEGPLLVSEH